MLKDENFNMTELIESIATIISLVGNAIVVVSLMNLVIQLIVHIFFSY